MSEKYYYEEDFSPSYNKPNLKYVSYYFFKKNHKISLKELRHLSEGEGHWHFYCGKFIKKVGDVL